MVKLIKRNGLLSFLFVSFFLIFIPVLPIGIETQPVLALFASVILLAGFSKNTDFLKKDVLYVEILFLVLLFYTLYQIFFRSEYQAIIELVKYLIGPVIFIAMRSSKFSISYSVLKKTVYGLAIVGGISFLLPSLYTLIFQFIIPRFADNVGSEARGIVILTPEPSYFATFEVILLVTIEKALSQLSTDEPDTLVNKKKLLYLKYIVLVLSLLTKSALVIIYALIFIIPSFKKVSIKKVLLIGLIVLPIVSLLVYFFFSSNRLFDIISLVFTLVKNNEFDLSSFLFTQESSGGTRVVLNFLAIASIFINPLGSGLGSFSNMMNFYGNYFNMDLSQNELLRGDTGNKIYPATYFASLCNDIGFFALLILPIVWVNNAKDSKNFILKRNLSLAVMILFQSQITNPAFWYLIAVAKLNPHEKIVK